MHRNYFVPWDSSFKLIRKPGFKTSLSFPKSRDVMRHVILHIHEWQRISHTSILKDKHSPCNLMAETHCRGFSEKITLNAILNVLSPRYWWNIKITSLRKMRPRYCLDGSINLFLSCICYWHVLLFASFLYLVLFDSLPSRHRHGSHRRRGAQASVHDDVSEIELITIKL